MYTGLNSLRFRAHTGFKIPFATSPHWILFATATWQKRGQHAAVNNFFIIQDKKQRSTAKVFRVKRSTKYVQIFFIPVGVNNSSVFLLRHLHQTTDERVICNLWPAAHHKRVSIVGRNVEQVGFEARFKYVSVSDGSDLRRQTVPRCRSGVRQRPLSEFAADYR